MQLNCPPVSDAPHSPPLLLPHFPPGFLSCLVCSHPPSPLLPLMVFDCILNTGFFLLSMPTFHGFRGFLLTFTASLYLLPLCTPSLPTPDLAVFKERLRMLTVGGTND